MRLLENVSLALSSLRANKMRAILTMLGIIIGIASVIAILTVGDSLTAYLSDTMQGMGANNVSLYLQERDQEASTGFGRDTMEAAGQYTSGMAEKNLMTDEMLEGMREEFGGEIEAVSLSDTVGSGQTTAGRLYANLTLMGVSEEYDKASSLTLLSGRFLSEKDAAGSKKVAVVSDKLTNNMFPEGEALGQQVTITVGDHTGTYTIVGLYQNEQSGGMAAEQDISTNVYIPLSTAQKMTRTAGYQNVTVLTATTADSDTIAGRLEEYFERYYAGNKDYKVSAFSMESMLDTVNSMLNTVQIAIAAIAAISLLVGGIGVMNIMMVSITERTREIGTRKAIGATNGEVRTQFIVEAVIICLIGGAIGIALGILLGMLGAGLVGAPASTSAAVILLAFGFSMLIGVFFGYYPANKAARLDPIEALRYE